MFVTCACICRVPAPLEFYLQVQILQHHGECGPGQGSPFALPFPLQLPACVLWQLSFFVRVNSVLKQSESFCYITALKCCSSSRFLPTHNLLGLLGLWIRKLGFRVYEFHSAYRLGCRVDLSRVCVVFHCDHGSFSEAPFSHLPLLSFTQDIVQRPLGPGCLQPWSLSLAGSFLTQVIPASRASVALGKAN